MTKLDYRNVEKTADRCGGKAVVVGTRLRVVTILSCRRLGMTVEEIAAGGSPHLRPADIHNAFWPMPTIIPRKWEPDFGRRR